jgi:putative flippase GtrA
VAYLLLYLLLRSVVAAQAANAVSLLLTAVANTAVNRRVTFGIRGRAHAARHQVRGLISFAIGLALTSGALAALHASAPRASRTAELTVLVAANLTATLVRFGLYRSWVFRHPRPGSPPDASAPDRPAAVPGPALPVSRSGAQPDVADGDAADRDVAGGDFR